MADLIGHLLPCCRHGRPRSAISCLPGRCSFAQPAETGPSRSLDVATPPFTAPAFGLSRNVVEQAPSCRLRRHRSLPGPSRTPVSAHSLRNQRPASVMAALPLSWPTGNRHGRPPVVCQTGNRHGRPRPAICRPAAVMAGLDRPSLPPSHHFRPFLSAWRLIFPVRPSFWAVFAGWAVVFVRQAVIFGPFCRLGGQFFPPGRHFQPFLLAQRSFLSARPSFLAVFAGLAVVFVRQAIIIFGPFCRLECRHGRPDWLPFCSGT